MLILDRHDQSLSGETGCDLQLEAGIRCWGLVLCCRCKLRRATCFSCENISPSEHWWGVGTWSGFMYMHIELQLYHFSLAPSPVKIQTIRHCLPLLCHPTGLFSFINLLLSVIYLTSPPISSFKQPSSAKTLIQLWRSADETTSVFVCVWFTETKVKPGLVQLGYIISSTHYKFKWESHFCHSLSSPPLSSHPTQPLLLPLLCALWVRNPLGGAGRDNKCF